MKRSDYYIWILIFVFGALYLVWGVNRYNHFLTDAIDLGLYSQLMWKYAHFKAPLSSIKYDTFPGPNMLGDHFHPILLLFVPFYWLWEDPRMLLVLQAVVVVLAAWPVYMVVLKALGSKAFSLATAFAYLSFIGVQTALDYDFHVTTLSVLPLALTLYALAYEKWRLYWIALLAGILTKEDVPLFTFVIGLVAVLKFKKEKVGLMTMLVSAISYLLITKLAIPYYKGENFAYEELDPSLGETATDLVKTTLLSPWVTAKVLVTPVLKFKTMVNLLASFSFFPLLDPVSLLLLGPNFASRFLTRLSQRWLIRYQYSVNIAPLLAVGSGWGLANLIKVFRKVKFMKVPSRVLLWGAAGALVASSLLQTYRTNTPLFRMVDRRQYQQKERFLVNNRLLAQIPDDASVMAQSCFVPQLAHRDAIYRYEDTLFGKGIYPDYVIMSAAEHSDPAWSRPELEERIEKLRLNSRYEEVYWDGERLLLRRLN